VYIWVIADVEIPMMRIRFLIIGFVMLFSSNAWADLRTFDVDPRYSQEIFRALQNILTPTGNPLVPTQGHVQLLPSGQILVNASPEALEQVEQVLQAIRSRRVDAAPRVELRYWAVLGSRESVANPPGAPVPSVLGPVLAELERLHGDLTFRVIGAASLTTESGQLGTVDGTTLDVAHTAYAQGESLNARINMELRNSGQLGPETALRGEIEVQTALRRGEFVVLGQSELVGGGLDGPVFFIVHWPEAETR
jgi:hypothetical protein